MFNCIYEQLCKLLGITDEKVNQVEELAEQSSEIIDQQTEICACLDALTGTDATTCPECENGLVSKMFNLFAFDNANGVFDEDYIHAVQVNGDGSVSNSPFDPTWTRKSEAYAPTIALINATPGWNATLINDVAVNANGKPEYLVEYIGAPGTSMELINQHNGDVYLMTIAEDGTCTGEAKDQDGNPFTSNGVVVVAAAAAAEERTEG